MKPFFFAAAVLVVLLAGDLARAQSPTAVAVVRRADSFLSEFIDTTRVAFRNLDRAAIERYVAREAPLDCAGGFKSEGLGISLCESIDNTDPTALIGLPLVRLAAVLRRFGSGCSPTACPPWRRQRRRTRPVPRRHKLRRRGGNQDASAAES